MIDALQFLPATPDESLLYIGSYDPVWVVISVLLAIIASYAALKASARVERLQDTTSKLIWILIGAFTLGIGIWAMHFIGMMALSLPCGVRYDPLITLISMIPGILAGGVALGVVWHHGPKHLPPLVGSVLLGVGIGTMHYIGMAAMRLEGVVRYDPSWFVLSIIVAVGLSYLALHVKNGVIGFKNHGDVLVAVILGGAVSGMHYTAMSAAYFVRGDVGTLPNSLFTTTTLAILIAVTTVFLALGALALATISRNREVTDKLRESEEKLRGIFEGSLDGIVLLEEKTMRVNTSNPAFASMLGYSLDEVNQLSVPDYHPQEDLPWIVEQFEKHMHGETQLATGIPVKRKDGSVFYADIKFAHMSFGGVDYLLGNFRDITERKRHESQILENEQRLLDILNVSPIAVRIATKQGREVVFYNPRYAELIKNIHATGDDPKKYYVRIDDYEKVLAELAQGKSIINRMIELQTPDGAKVWTLASYMPTKYKGEDAVLGWFYDITERKAAEEEIRNLAFYDPLTQLPNRRFVLERLQHALASCARNNRQGALLIIDVDHFKTLNDTLGHDIGDLLLQQIAKRLTASVREGDTVARLGGDEFVVILEDLSELPSDAAVQTEIVGEKIRATFSQPYQLVTYEHRSTLSIGATLFNGQPSSIEELMKQADIAMYQAKKAGRNTLRFFDPRMQEAINARAALERELNNALESRQFQLYYQIQVDNSKRPLGAEALIRWIHHVRGLVSPDQFIPLAEETGLILPIGLWVLETACAQLKTWEQDALTCELVLAINVSARQFRQADFVDQVRDAIRRHAINPRLLKLELTESLLQENIEDTIAIMSELNGTGVQFSLDDFGTGYSSLQYLKRLPLDQIKIDRSFVLDIATDGSDIAVVRAIIAMARSLELDVIAEGVETEKQRQLLLKNGCNQFQGFLFSKPVSIEQFEALLKQG